MVHFVILVLENTRKSGVSALILEVCRVENKKKQSKMQPQTQPQTQHFVFARAKMQPQTQPQVQPQTEFSPIYRHKKARPGNTYTGTSFKTVQISFKFG